jgi:hypothetical protein
VRYYWYLSSIDMGDVLYWITQSVDTLSSCQADQWAVTCQTCE